MQTVIDTDTGEVETLHLKTIKFPTNSLVDFIEKAKGKSGSDIIARKFLLSLYLGREFKLLDLKKLDDDNFAKALNILTLSQGIQGTIEQLVKNGDSIFQELKKL